MQRKVHLAIIASLLCCGSNAFITSPMVPSNTHYSTPLQMQPMQSDDNIGTKKRRIETLAAVSVSDDWPGQSTSTVLKDLSQQNVLESTFLPVISSASLITGNTVGAGMLVLPELAIGPGLAISTSIFFVAFLVNLISGLLIAEVAIHQHSTSGSDVPSSFKKFAQANLPNFGNSSMDDSKITVADVISGASVMVNALVLAFNTAKIGDFGTDLLHGAVPENAISLGWAFACVLVVASQTFSALSNVASILVGGLFLSFAGLLLPGLAAMEANPMELLFKTPGLSDNVIASSCQLAPIILMSLVYQNIVPTVTKLLDYDRVKTIAAISLGSFIPTLMYIVWTFCVVGGGVDTNAGGLMDGPLMTIFTLCTLGGSSLGCVMSISEEFDTYVSNGSKDSLGSSSTHAQKADKYTLPSVVGSVACAIAAAKFFEQDLNGALQLAGSFGTPLLYGFLPVLMAYTQRQERSQRAQFPPPKPLEVESFELPSVSLGLLGMASTGFVGNELIHGAQSIMETASII